MRLHSNLQVPAAPAFIGWRSSTSRTLAVATSRQLQNLRRRNITTISPPLTHRPSRTLRSLAIRAVTATTANRWHWDQEHQIKKDATVPAPDPKPSSLLCCAIRSLFSISQVATPRHTVYPHSPLFHIHCRTLLKGPHLSRSSNPITAAPWFSAPRSRLFKPNQCQDRNQAGGESCLPNARGQARCPS